MSAREMAQAGVAKLKAAVLKYLAAQPQGVMGVDIADALGLKSKWRGGWKDGLVWGLLAMLTEDGRVRHEKVGRNRYFFLASQPVSGE
jgi:hypothetical protein